MTTKFVYDPLMYNKKYKAAWKLLCKHLLSKGFRVYVNPYVECMYDVGFLKVIHRLLKMGATADDLIMVADFAIADLDSLNKAHNLVHLQKYYAKKRFWNFHYVLKVSGKW